MSVENGAMAAATVSPVDRGLRWLLLSLIPGRAVGEDEETS